MLTKFKKYLQSFHPNDQLHEVNEIIEYVNCSDINDL